MKQSARFCFAILAAGLLCLTFAVGTQAFAATENPCSKDIEKFCKNIKPGRTALLTCLEAHESELSAACKAYEEKMEGRRQETMEQAKIVKKFRQDCKADMVKFCSGAESAKGGTLKCMNEHKGELSPTCSQWVKALNQE